MMSMIIVLSYATASLSVRFQVLLIVELPKADDGPQDADEDPPTRSGAALSASGRARVATQSQTSSEENCKIALRSTLLRFSDSI